MILESGTGNGRSAAVTAENRLECASKTTGILDYRLIQGNAFNFNPSTITLTTGNESALWYLKSNATAIAGVGTNLLIPAVVVMIGDAAGTLSTEWRIKAYRNPTAGTLVDSGTAGSPLNRNFASNREFDGTTLYGAEGSTITASEGVVFETLLPQGSSGRFVIPVSLFLQQGNSVAFSIEPPTGNTSVDIQIAASFYMIDLSNI